MCQKHNLTCVPTSKNYKLKHLLGTTKDRVPPENKAGIYLAKCGGGDDGVCDAVYVGQTKRSMKKRASEHLTYIKNIDGEKSAIAEHCLQQHHHLGLSDFRLLSSTDDFRRLNVLESLYIHQNREKAVNRDDGPGTISRLMKLI